MRLKKLQNTLLITAFFLLLITPTLDLIFNFSPIKDLFEKRLPVEKPALPSSYEDVKSYPKNFEKFFNDNYGFRKTLIFLNNQITDKIFDESPDARAVVGKDDWFYFDNHNSLLDATGKATLSDEVVARGVDSFYKNWQELRAKNIDYLLVIAADKSTIYPEFLPDYIKPAEPHRIDKFLNALKKKHPDFPVLDLRPILVKAKEREIIYHKTDTHWNKRGAHYAYVEIAKKLHIKPHLRKDFITKEDEMISGDISDIMNSDAKHLDYNLFPNFREKSHKNSTLPEFLKDFHRPYFFTNDDKNLPTIFVYKDSYFSDLAGFVAEHFSQSIYVNEFPCDLNSEIIKNFHPNVVIQEFWEGRIEVVLNKCQS